MVLHRETDEALIGEIAGLKAPWVQSETLDSLVELNGQCLELLAEQSLTQPMQGNLLLVLIFCSMPVSPTQPGGGRWMGKVLVRQQHLM
jgi:hypothetical protein